MASPRTKVGTTAGIKGENFKNQAPKGPSYLIKEIGGGNVRTGVLVDKSAKLIYRWSSRGVAGGTTYTKLTKDSDQKTALQELYKVAATPENEVDAPRDSTKYRQVGLDVGPRTTAYIHKTSGEILFSQLGRADDVVYFKPKAG